MLLISCIAMNARVRLRSIFSVVDGIIHYSDCQCQRVRQKETRTRNNVNRVEDIFIVEPYVILIPIKKKNLVVMLILPLVF